MIDIETLSTKPNAAILTIGAIKFSRKGDIKKLKDCDTFYRRVDWKNLQKKDYNFDEDTLDWWYSQKKHVRDEALDNGPRYPIEKVLDEFSAWYKGSKIVWANSPSFDCVILENAYQKCKRKPPWKFWSTRDLRTLYDLGGGVRKSDIQNPEAHNALNDAYTQVVGAKHAFHNLTK